jgi:hypothetical protein
MKHQFFQHRSGVSHRMICRASRRPYAFDDRHLMALMAITAYPMYRRLVIGVLIGRALPAERSSREFANRNDLKLQTDFAEMLPTRFITEGVGDLVEVEATINDRLDMGSIDCSDEIHLMPAAADD